MRCNPADSRQIGRPLAAWSPWAGGAPVAPPGATCSGRLNRSRLGRRAGCRAGIHARDWRTSGFLDVARYPSRMCRSIRPLRVAEPPTTDGDVRAAALQYIRKVSGSRTLPRRHADAFEAAIDEVAAATARLLAALGTLPVSGEATPPALWPRSGRQRGAGHDRGRETDRPAPGLPAPGDRSASRPVSGA